ncbi:unnamed protein product [Rotaria sp. Silwood2]|nr:unnamed protein product [Rotaria sp. Silwood2]
MPSGMLEIVIAEGRHLKDQDTCVNGDTSSIPSLKSDNEEFLPLIKYLIESRNTTVYQWRTRGHVSASVKRPPLNYKFIDAAEVNEEEPNIILRLDDDLTTTMTEGIAVKQTVNQTDVVDFDAETEID